MEEGRTGRTLDRAAILDTCTARRADPAGHSHRVAAAMPEPQLFNELLVRVCSKLRMRKPLATTSQQQCRCIASPPSRGGSRSQARRDTRAHSLTHARARAARRERCGRRPRWQQLVWGPAGATRERAADRAAPPIRRRLGARQSRRRVPSVESLLCT